MTHSPGAVSLRVAVPRPKWKSSVPWNVPERGGVAVQGAAVAWAVAPKDGDSVAGEADDRPGGADATSVPVDPGSPLAGRAATAASASGGSTSSVRMKIGETRYHASGATRTRPTTAADPAAIGWRRTRPAQPYRRAARSSATTRAQPAMATASRSS